MRGSTNIYHVGCSTDDNYIHHASVMICSLLENNRGNEIFIHVLHGGLSAASMDILKRLADRYSSTICFHQVDHNQLEGVIKEISGNALMIEKKGMLEAVNLDFVVRIREYPRNKKGNKKSVVLD